MWASVVRHDRTTSSPLQDTDDGGAIRARNPPRSQLGMGRVRSCSPQAQATKSAHGSVLPLHCKDAEASPRERTTVREVWTMLLVKNGVIPWRETAERG